MTKVSRWASPLLAFMIAAVACGGSSSSGSGTTAVQTVTVGYAANLTGAGESYGVPFNNGLKLALADIKSSGAMKSSNVTIQLDTQDAGSLTATAVTLYNKFSQAKDPIVISDSLSPIGKAIAPLANSDKVVFISGGGSELPNSDGYAFHLADLGTPMKTLGSKMQSGGSKAVAAIVDGDNPSFPTLTTSAETAFKAAGGSAFVATQKISSKDSDFSSVLTNLRQANPDTIFISALPEQSGNIIRQIRQFGGLDKVKIVGTVSWGPQVYDVGKGAAVGAVFASIWAPGSSSSAAFEKAYQAAYKTTPVAYSALGYETGWLLAATFNKIVAGGAKVTSAAVKDGLPTASTADLVQSHGVIPGFALAATGAATYPGALSVFSADGTIKAGS